MRATKRKAKSIRPVHRPKVAQRQPNSQQTAIMRIPAPVNESWKLTQDEVSIVKAHIAKGATDKELEFCLAVARRHKLDPFRGQIWFVKRNDQSAEGGYRWIPIVGIGGMLHIAARDHKDFGSNDEPEFGPMKEVKWSYYQKSGKIQAPEWAKVKLWKKGHDHPIVATVFWDEIYPDVGAAPLVRQMPRLMLGKCALAQAVRRAYPATDGLYIKEEFQGPEQFTPGGRQIVEQVNPHEQKYLEREAAALEKLTPEQREIVERKTAKPAAVEATSYLFAVHFPESDTYEIIGGDKLDASGKRLLLPFWNNTSKTIVVNAEQLDGIKFEFEKQGIQIRPLKRP